MITARQFRNGSAIEIGKDIFKILESQHTKPGKGGAFVRAKLKNLKSGAIAERTFRPDESFRQAYIEQKIIQYLYHDETIYHFMDQATYEQMSINKSVLGNIVKFLKDGMEVTASVHNETIVDVTVPVTVTLKVTYTEPGIRGDTAKGGSKPATLETGAVIRVPLFVNTDDIIKVDTRTSLYAGRA
ncbi:MAG: elongation factor P [Omnitrophica bacterium]|nr:elongation factor P [Candidatus Omnitrophota bacterium]